MHRSCLREGPIAVIFARYNPYKVQQPRPIDERRFSVDFRSPYRLYSGIVFLLLSVACSEPPTEEMMQAEAAIQAAQAEGAEEYVSEDYRAAADALADAKSKSESRDYEAAKVSALDARQKADLAKVKVLAEKLKLRGEVESTLTALGEEWDELMASTARKRLNRDAKAGVAAGRKEYAGLIKEARARADAEDYVGSMQVLTEARSKANDVRAIAGGR